MEALCPLVITPWYSAEDRQKAGADMPKAENLVQKNRAFLFTSEGNMLPYLFTCPQKRHYYLLNNFVRQLEHVYARIQVSSHAFVSESLRFRQISVLLMTTAKEVGAENVFTLLVWLRYRFDYVI